MNAEIVHRLDASFSRVSDMFRGYENADYSWPKREYHKHLDEKDLMRAVITYTENIQECIELLQEKESERKQD